MRNRGDRRGLNPRQLEPQGSTRDGKLSDCEGCSICESTQEAPEFPQSDGESVPGPDIRERPILFSAPMVHALLAGKKTQTRRLLTVPWKGSRRTTPYEPYWVDADGVLQFCDEYGDYHDAVKIMAPYGRPGDRLWVRETWHPSDSGPVLFAADYESMAHAGVERWFPSIHMRRADSRITLEITDVRVERLQAITEDDARAEGVTRAIPPPPAPSRPLEGLSGVPTSDTIDRIVESFDTARGAFELLWDEINGNRAPWSSNPWVWALTFKRVTP